MTSKFQGQMLAKLIRQIKVHSNKERKQLALERLSHHCAGPKAKLIYRKLLIKINTQKYVLYLYKTPSFFSSLTKYLRIHLFWTKRLSTLTRSVVCSQVKALHRPLIQCQKPGGENSTDMSASLSFPELKHTSRNLSRYRYIPVQAVTQLLYIYHEIFVSSHRAVEAQTHSSGRLQLTDNKLSKIQFVII